MNTELLPFSEQSAKKAAEIMAAGGVVGIPTETVYGLAADARNEAAVRSIFEAKGRPQDNPLIVHISALEQLPPLVREIPELALKIAEKYWPGPLTMIFPKSDMIPSATSGGLDTVAVRMPESPAARAIIDACGFPLAAPSANLSGSPSPTTAQHVMNDMNGRIPLIIDGGECRCGVESTVLCFPAADRVRILRPGGVTAEMLSELCQTDIDPAVTSEPPKGAKVMSPGHEVQALFPEGGGVHRERPWKAVRGLVHVTCRRWHPGAFRRPRWSTECSAASAGTPQSRRIVCSRFSARRTTRARKLSMSKCRQRRA